ncbi:MAG: OmpA family protein [Deltaproteobacteria bacterium]|jgi:outer membrane protein OmpA-like peptidoglycan-associated protein|nr:OmpA family protein [Deltaproteobacteria bacterium]
MKKFAAMLLVVCFVVVGLAATTHARKRVKKCDFHQWPIRHCKKPATLVLDGINFRTGSAQIDPRSYNLLDKSAWELRDHPELNFTIVGHTDSVGGKASNQVLSEKRAKAVKKYFIDYGINPYRIKTMGMGETQPIAAEGDGTKRYENRRIEIVFD